ncbi:MAG: preprotein translocase subunit YajC, partial [Holosporales bacterium]|nr:preprotein translocase subunit YajC [Holosporales bacterium]
MLHVSFFVVFGMLLFIGSAVADAPKSPSGGNLLSSIFPMVFLFAIFYFLLIRPQQKRAKQHKALVASVKKGDRVVTNSGIIGVVAKVPSDQEVIVEIAEKVFVKFLKSTIADIVRPGAEIAKPSAGITKSETSIAESGAEIAKPSAGIAKSEASIAESGAGIAESGAGIAESGAGIAESGAEIAKPSAGIAESEASIAESGAGMAEA